MEVWTFTPYLLASNFICLVSQISESIDTKDDLFTSGEVLRKLYLSSFGVDSLPSSALGSLLGIQNNAHHTS